MSKKRFVLVSGKSPIVQFHVDAAAFDGLDVEVAEVEIGTERATEALKTADVVMATVKVDAELIATLERARGVCILGHGFDKVDLKAATEAGIIIVNTPYVCHWEVANHAAGMILALNRSLVQYDRAVHRGVWDRPAGRPIGPLEGEVAAMIGFGAIGRSLAKRLQPFGLKVIGFDPFAEDWAFREYGVERIRDLHETLAASDYVSVQVPFNEQTRHMISDDEFQAMKPNAALVCCGRGGVVDEDALLRALQKGDIAKAGLDVFEKEPCDPSHPLLKLDNFIAAPHAGGESTISADWCLATGISLAATMLRGEWPRYVINRDVQRNLRPYEG